MYIKCFLIHIRPALSENPESELEINEEFEFLNAIPDSTKYINCDNDVQCYGDLTESEIIETIKDNPQIDEENMDGLQNDEEDACSNQIPSL